MIKLFALSALLLALPTVVPALTITDTFTNAANWGMPVSQGGSMSVGSGRMNYTSSSTLNTTGGGYITRNTPLLPTTQNWSLKVDAHLDPFNLATNTGQFSDVFLGFAKTGDLLNNRVMFEFGRSGVEEGSEHYGYYIQDNVRTNGVNVPWENKLFNFWQLPSGDVALRMDYNAADQTLTYYFDSDGPANGYNWVSQGSANLASGTFNLNLAPTNTFTIQLVGSSGFQNVAAGQAYLANLEITVDQPSQYPIAATTGTELAMNVASDGTNYLVPILGNAASGNNITAQLFSPAGSLVGSRLSMGRTGSVPGGIPFVAYGSNTYLMVWEDSATAKDITYGQLITRAGALQGSAFQIANSNSVRQTITPPGVAFGTTNFLVVWNDDRNASFDIYGRLVSPGGVLGSEFAIATGSAKQIEPAVAFDGNNYLVVWEQMIGSQWDVYGVLVSQAGTVGSAFKINQTSSPSYNPLSVAFDGSKYLVVWNRDVGSGSIVWDIYARFVTTGGAASGSEFAVTTAAGGQVMPQLAFGQGKYCILWSDKLFDGTGDYTVTGRFFNPSGQPVGAEFKPFAIVGSSRPMLAGIVNDGSRFVAVGALGTVVSATKQITSGDVYAAFIQPEITITAPLSGQRCSNAVFAVAGSASGNLPVTNVWYQLNGNGWLSGATANGWLNWTAEADLIPGTNLLETYAMDSAGNKSVTNRVNFQYAVTDQLQISMTGKGAISPNYSNAWLNIGQNYSITSAPAAGFTFTNWTSSQGWTSNSAALTFTMASNLTLTANFIDTNKPVLSITNLIAGQRVSNAVFTVTGAAADNSGVSAVWYQLNGGDWTLANTTNQWTNWWAGLSLTAGTNTLKTYAMDSSGGGNVYVADGANNLIRKISPAGAVTTLAGGGYGYADGVGGAAKFRLSWDGSFSLIATDGSGNLYLADTFNNLIRKITHDGVVTTLAGDVHDLTNGISNDGYADGVGGAAKFVRPSGVAVDGSNNVYVADNNLIRKITPAGVVTTLAGDVADLTNGIPNYGYADGVGGAAKFNYITGLAVDASGNVYVGETGNNLIRKVSPAGVVTTLAGNIYDLTNNYSQNYATNDGYADGAGGAAKFKWPNGLAVDDLGIVYVADRGNNLIRKITPAGVVTTLAGDVYDLTNGINNYGFADGVGVAAKFGYPLGVVVDGSGNVFVTDISTCLIRKITPAGVVTTLAGDVYDLTNGIPNYGYADGVGGAAKFNFPAGIAVDNSGGNLSLTNSVSFQYVVTNQLQISLTGKGTISPNYSNAWLEIGRNYNVTSAPAAGFRFTNWTSSQGWTSNPAALTFLMASNLTLTANFIDTNKPTMSITNLVAGQRWSNAVFTVRGTASDNWQVASVQYQLNGLTWSNAMTTNAWTNWYAALNLVPGTNTVAAFATDTTGNVSATTNVSFQYVVTNQLSIRTTGKGTISPNYSNAWLEIGRNYSVTSAPATGFVFTNWTVSTNWIGGATVTGTNLPFMMQSNLTLLATFVETSRPTLTFSAPTNLQKMTNALVTGLGTASDNWQISNIWYQLNGSAWNPAMTANNFTNWRTPMLTLVVGTNTLKAYALNLGGNYSITNSVSFVSSNTFALQLVFTNAMPVKTNGLVFNLQLSSGLNGRIQVSTNLIDWTSLTNFVGTNATITVRDPAATNSVQRFYRAVTP